MSPPSWGTNTSYIGDISGNHEQISTKMSATNPLPRLMSNIFGAKY